MAEAGAEASPAGARRGVRSFAESSQFSLVEEWKDGKELIPKPQVKWIIVDQKKEDQTSNGVVRRNQQVSVHEMGKKQQIHEDARKMHRTKNIVGKLWTMENASIERS